MLKLGFLAKNTIDLINKNLRNSRFKNYFHSFIWFQTNIAPDGKHLVFPKLHKNFLELNLMILTMLKLCTTNMDKIW